MKSAVAAVLAAASLILLPRPDLHPPVETLGDRAGWYASADQESVLHLLPGAEPASLSARILLPDDRAWIDLEGVLYPDELRLRSVPDKEGKRLRVGGRFGPDGSLRVRVPGEILLKPVRNDRASGPTWSHPIAWASCEHPDPQAASFRLAEALAQAREEARDRTWEEFRQLVDGVDDPPLGRYTYAETWSAGTLTPALASLLGEIRYDFGGAHPNSAYRTRTFWHSGTGVVELELEDLFRPGSGWLVELRRLALVQLWKAGASNVVESGAAALKVGDLAFWFLSDRALEFRFAPYAMGCYAEGSFQVSIPFEWIAEWLAPKGPLGDFAD